MPPASRTVARDEMMNRLRVALAASGTYASISVIHDDVQEKQPGVEQGVPAVPAGKPWLRVGVKHDPAGAPASIGGSLKRYEMVGLISVQVFTPYGDGLRISDDLVEVVLDAYRIGGATPSGVQFTSAGSEEIGKDGVWFQANCVIEFTYDQFK